MKNRNLFLQLNRDVLELKLFFLVLITSVLPAMSQGISDKVDNSIKTSFIPASPSPNAYEMVKHIDFEEVESSGVVSLSVPLYTVKSNDLSHDIGLSYLFGGVRVSQEASWVGLGFNLNYK